MSKVKSFDDLKKMREKLQSEMQIRENSNNPDDLPHINISMGTCGISAGARDVMSAFVDSLAEKNIQAIVSQKGCMGYCDSEPVAEVVMPGKEPVLYGEVTPAMITAIIERHILKGETAPGVINRK